MCDIEFDPDAVGQLPARLEGLRHPLATATTVPAPDTGATTAPTRAALDRLVDLCRRLDDQLADLADGVRRSVDLYDATDDSVSRMMAARVAGVGS